jgi:hypothetical protein
MWNMDTYQLIYGISKLRILLKAFKKDDGLRLMIIMGVFTGIS